MEGNGGNSKFELKYRKILNPKVDPNSDYLTKKDRHVCMEWPKIISKRRNRKWPC